VAESAPGSLPCYTFAGMHRDCHDVRVARQVARGANSLTGDHGGAEFFPLAHYAERAVYLTDACVDVALSLICYLREARAIAPSECRKLWRGPASGPSVQAAEPLAGSIARNCCRRFTGTGHIDRLIRQHRFPSRLRQAPWHHFGVLALEQRSSPPNSLPRHDFVRTVFRAPDVARTTSDVCLRLIGDGSSALRRIPTDRGSGLRLPLIAAAHGECSSYIQGRIAYDYGCLKRSLKSIIAFTTQARASISGTAQVLPFPDVVSGCSVIVCRDMLLTRVHFQSVSGTDESRTHRERSLKGDRNYTTEIHKLSLSNSCSVCSSIPDPSREWPRDDCDRRA